MAASTKFIASNGTLVTSTDALVVAGGAGVPVNPPFDASQRVQLVSVNVPMSSLVASAQIGVIMVPAGYSVLCAGAETLSATPAGGGGIQTITVGDTSSATLWVSSALTISAASTVATSVAAQAKTYTATDEVNITTSGFTGAYTAGTIRVWAVLLNTTY